MTELSPTARERPSFSIFLVFWRAVSVHGRCLAVKQRSAGRVKVASLPHRLFRDQPGRTNSSVSVSRLEVVGTGFLQQVNISGTFPPIRRLTKYSDDWRNRQLRIGPSFSTSDSLMPGSPMVSASVGGGTVLVVAFSPLLARNLSDLIRGAGYRVDFASEETNWDKCALTVVQLAVLLSSEPYWGVEQICKICSAIRCKAPNLPVIVIGRDDVETKVRLFELGADDYVREPFDRTELLARIKAQIRRQLPVEFKD